MERIISPYPLHWIIAMASDIIYLSLEPLFSAIKNVEDSIIMIIAVHHQLMPRGPSFPSQINK